MSDDAGKPKKRRRRRRIREFNIEDSWFASRVLDFGILAYGSHTYENWKELAPDRVYAFDVHVRMERLRRHVWSLNDLPKLFTFEGLPLPSPCGNLGRTDWLEVCIEVALARLTSVRDITFLLVSDTFELGLDDRGVTFKKLKSRDLPWNVIALVGELAEVAVDLRHERDKRVHRGMKRKFGGADHTMLYMASMAEARGWPPGNIDALPSASHEGQTYSLAEKCREIADELLREFLLVARKLLKATIAVIDSLASHFEPRFAEKLSRSKLGLS